VPTLTLPVSARRLAAVLLLLALGAVVGFRHLSSRGRPAALVVAPVRAAAAQRPAARVSLVVVDVEGAVRQPGLVRLRSGARVAEAVSRAGGFAPKADRAGVNLAAPLADGQQVVVPRAGAPPTRVASGSASASRSASASPAPGEPVSLNTATAEQLDTLPGIGPVTAQKIVTFREQHGPFHSVDGLDAIPGIGPARLAELQGLVVP
jgi:competence protein ComEA